MIYIINDSTEGITQEEAQTMLAQYQDKLASGTNIKTINGKSVLGSGNLPVTASEGGSADYSVSGETLSISATVSGETVTLT